MRNIVVRLVMTMYEFRNNGLISEQGFNIVQKIW